MKWSRARFLKMNEPKKQDKRVEGKWMVVKEIRKAPVLSLPASLHLPRLVWLVALTGACWWNCIKQWFYGFCSRCEWVFVCRYYCWLTVSWMSCCLMIGNSMRKLKTAGNRDIMDGVMTPIHSFGRQHVVKRWSRRELTRRGWILFTSPCSCMFRIPFPSSASDSWWFCR